MLLNHVEARARQARGARWEGEASGDGLDGAALGGDWTKAGRGVGIVPRGGPSEVPDLVREASCVWAEKNRCLQRA